MFFNDGWHMGGGMWIFWLIVIAAFVGLPWFFFRGKFGQGKDEENSPKGILRKRYAKGEIDKKEFDEKMKDLE